VTLRAPFPWWGGKSRAASMIWRAFGNVPNYVEPFFGSGGVLLGRPGGPGKVETVNDLDCYVSNFWRSVQHDPEAVAVWADHPVNEADLHARHAWLVAREEFRAKMYADPDYYDPKIAGWWVWGLSCWIGNGWCSKDERLNHCLPKVGTPGHGMHAPTRWGRPAVAGAPTRQIRPRLSPQGVGVQVLRRQQGQQMPRLSDPGEGINARRMRQQFPDLSAIGRGVHAKGKKPRTHRGVGVHRAGLPEGAFAEHCDRLRNVRIVCGDFRRVLGRSTLGIDTSHGMTPCGVLLDPPYAHELREKRLYREDDAGIAELARAWAVENGDNPALRIALCGYQGEHTMPRGWRSASWKSQSGFDRADQERIWFSPHCLETTTTMPLFTDEEDPPNAAAE